MLVVFVILLDDTIIIILVISLLITLVIVVRREQPRQLQMRCFDEEEIISFVAAKVAFTEIGSCQKV